MQLEHIAENVEKERADWIRNEVLPKYRALLTKIPPIEQLQRTAGLFAFGHAPEEAAAIAPYYNKAINVPDFPPLETHLHSDLDLAGVENTYFEADPRVAVVDNVLSPQALQRIRDILQESTVWFAPTSARHHRARVSKRLRRASYLCFVCFIGTRPKCLRDLGDMLVHT